eukprot:TRINITY_DN58208_c0_g1_i1.p1 TRINITY_DN58208_c0_g1~~TRINITY_DN58208_c0_g1_i1.p1  ORF type:complete len:594 (-),score=82.98 TRINITY_DN58208_c0_g1_i1:334-2115(-)
MSYSKHQEGHPWPDCGTALPSLLEAGHDDHEVSACREPHAPRSTRPLSVTSSQACSSCQSIPEAPSKKARHRQASVGSSSTCCWTRFCLESVASSKGAACSRHAACDEQSMEHEREMTYDLQDPRALANFLEDADIRLVRAEYLGDLHRKGAAFPRRQEAERAMTNSGRTALVSPEEVWHWVKWAELDNEERQSLDIDRSCSGRIWSLSHCWESREHPDPFSHQLGVLVTGLKNNFLDDKDIWLFVDYISLYQYKRKDARQQRSFERAMCNMHVMYAHNWTWTVRIGELTPCTLADTQKGGSICIYHEPSNNVLEIPLASVKTVQEDGSCGVGCGSRCPNLHANTTLYAQRGWCQAELQWSNMRDRSRSLVLPSRAGSDSKAPMPPEVFSERVKEGQLKFTHRDDEATALRLQAMVFADKASKCQKLDLSGLHADELPVLFAALPYYTCLEDLRLILDSTDDAAQYLAEAFTSKELLRNLKRIYLGQKLGHTGVKALAEALAENTSVEELDLSFNRDIGDAGAAALANALHGNTTVRELRLSLCGIGNDGAKALAQAFENNTTLQTLHLHPNTRIEDEGKQALSKLTVPNLHV